MKHLEVACGLIRMYGKWFACKRKKDKILGGYWEFPGGKIEVGETPDLALVREIKEELDAQVSIVKFIGKFDYEYIDISTPFSIALYAYECKLESGGIKLLEHEEGGFYTREEMLGLNFAKADFQIIEALK